MKKLSQIIPLILLCNCGKPLPPRHPDRDLCYLDAEVKADKAIMKQCIGYESTDLCPYYPAINSELKKEQEACP